MKTDAERTHEDYRVIVHFNLFVEFVNISQQSRIGWRRRWWRDLAFHTYRGFMTNRTEEIKGRYVRKEHTMTTNTLPIQEH